MTPFERVQQLIETNLLDTVYLGTEVVIMATKDDRRYIYRANDDEIFSIENELVRFGYLKTIVQPKIGSVYSVDIDKKWKTNASPYNNPAPQA